MGQMHGSVAFGKLVIVLDECGFNGNVKKLWEELAGTRGGIHFTDIDPESAKILDGFRCELTDRCGCLARAWKEGIDPGNLGKIDEGEFHKSLEELGIVVKNEKKIFRMLCARPYEKK